MNEQVEQDEGQDEGGAGIEMDEELEEIRCGQCEKPPIKIAKDPRVPTQREVDDHNVIHLPHRSWRPICIKARGREEPHWRGTEKGSKPTVSVDYKEFGEEADVGDKIKQLGSVRMRAERSLGHVDRR